MKAHEFTKWTLCRACQVPLVWLAGAILGCHPAAAATVLVEAESFDNPGGWKLDTQFIHVMGSPYLLAHGLGEPVADATTSVPLPRPGAYRVFVRTKDWMARWRAPGAPGRFQLGINGTPLGDAFGTRSVDWAWEAGGAVPLTGPSVRLALHDVTGFDGRCDAVLLTDDPDFVPPTDPTPGASWRRDLAGRSERPTDLGPFDLVVVGGGYAGIAAAVSAARMGCRVALIQDRPVLGGNGSSEVRVWPQGLTRRGRYPQLGEIVEEFADRPKTSPGTPEEYDDARREAFVRAEPNLALHLNCAVFAVETRDQRITAVTGLDTRTGERTRFAGRFFADCTGHAFVGWLAGADHETQAEGHLGMSNMWRWRNLETPQPFPDVPWALPLAMKDFPYPRNGLGPWFWESGFNLDPVQDVEAIRDWNLRAVFGAFNAMKNGEGRDQHRNARLEWVAYVGGNRESRRLLGDVILTRDDVVSGRLFPDGCVPSTWDIDLHYPEEKYASAASGNPFISRADFGKGVDKTHGYAIPFRCLYSRNVRNLFMAGRCISVTHEALGTVRVQKTTGMMGEVVGKAAAVCLEHQRSPAEIHPALWGALDTLLHLPGSARRESLGGVVRIPEGTATLQ